MNKRIVLSIVALAILVSAAAALLLFRPLVEEGGNVLKVGIAPYQDMAMLAAVKPMGIDKANGLDVQLVSMQWADLTPAVASAGATVDVAFASLIQFIAQEPSLNADSKDPLVFFYPAYVFRGGAFVSFNTNVPEVTKENLQDSDLLKRFLAFRFAVQSTSSYEILLYDLARRAGVQFSDVKRFDIDSSDGLLAALNGSVDAAAAGLTQKNEAIQKGGRVVLEMDALGQVDIAGFIARRSTIEQRRNDLVRLMRVWVQAIDFVMSDIQNNSKYSLDYLRHQSSTDYTMEQYRSALSQEWLPRSIEDVQSTVIAANGQYYYKKVEEPVVTYYVENKLVSRPPKHIEILDIDASRAPRQ